METAILQAEPYLVPITPATPTPLPEVVDALRTITPLAGLADEEYVWLANHGTERISDGGDALIFREGAPTSHLVFILRGEVHVRRRHSGPMALFVGRAGQMTGKLPFSRMKFYGGDGYTIGPSWVLDIHESLFPEMLQAIPSMAQRCVSVLLDRVREVTRMEQQAEKLSALGKLAGNLSHELNNPASAAQRSAASLFGELRKYGDQKYLLGSLSLTPEQSRIYKDWVTRTRASMASYSPQTVAPQNPLAFSDREEQLTKWLIDHNVTEPWTIAPSLSETRITLEHLDDLARHAPPELIPITIGTFATSLRVERMTEAIVDSTVRIFDLISAIKDYSYMDQAPIQDIEIAQSLEATLAMFSSRLQGITIERDFDPALPPISAYGSELSQVWTALIENAIEAIRSSGEPGVLSLRTCLTGTMATVEIRNNGPEIDPAIQSRIFEPFFTTKAPGHGLGLGLDTAQRIVNRHSGFLTVESNPGATCFQVRLPLDQAQAY
ncbi:MAG TPA: ATP-binding protein [Edaphobacter sp.]|uniref:sensor histidine kinase n=1 Tax=Edaphobacter sp. TaxID=1934404 RepID=UPI002C3ACA54|nr:ATP-binding protein [Edaphobacter sp.]HUZ94840.1 ATP-binding protein [Edaphobacter sp.]